jgi:uncharacterized protein YbaA (DUF1428 family)
MPYVDGFLIPLPKKNLAAYRKIAAKAGKIWMDLGALEYRECIADDLKVKNMTSFTRSAGAKPGETVVFSWVVYKNKAHRDRVNAKLMKDPRLLKLMKTMKMPFDGKRMAYGGFKTIVDLP